MKKSDDLVKILIVAIVVIFCIVVVLIFKTFYQGAAIVSGQGTNLEMQATSIEIPQALDWSMRCFVNTYNSCRGGNEMDCYDEYDNPIDCPDDACRILVANSCGFTQASS